MPKNLLKFTYFLSVALFLLTACGDIPLRQWLSHRAQVVDIDTGKPLEGVIVLARWKGRKSMLVDTQGTCYHVETATTDKKGWFEIPSYNEGFGKASIFRKHRHLAYYKEGYIFYTKTNPYISHAKKITMKKFKGTREERFRFLSKFNTSCGVLDGGDKNSFNIRKPIYEEAKLLAKTSKDMRALNFMLMKIEKIKYGPEEAQNRLEKRLEGKM